MKTIFGKRNRQSGQASLEMVLTLVIGMMIALGLIYRFNTAFRKYTVDMYGTYYRCLLETGELPGVGSVCKDRKARFDIANGKKLVGSGGEGGGSSGGSDESGSKGGSGSSGDSSSGKGSSKNASSGNSGSGSSGGGGSGDSPPETVSSGGGGGGGRGGSVIGRLRGLQKSKSTAVGSLGKDEKGSGDAARPPAIAAARSRGANDSLRGARTKMNFEMEGSGYARLESAGITPTTATARTSTKKDDRGDSLRPRKAEEKTGRAVAGKLDADKGGGLEFGKLFRLLLIIGIIVAIVIFLGGQVLQISKSGER